MKLGDVVQINPESVGQGYPHSEIQYVDISSVGTGTMTGFTAMLIAEAPSRAKRIVRSGDTLLATVRPNLRSFCYLRNPPSNAVASTGFAVLRATEKIDNRFLYFTIINQSFTDFLCANVKGAAYPAVDTETVARAEIELPDLSTQRRIASILSAYDDLIENNTRRIAILEEMARRIYEEWFARFLFPGHEKVRMVESELGLVPEGWCVGQLSDVVRLLPGFAFKTQDFVEDGTFGLVTIKNVQDGEFVPECTSRLATVPLKMPPYCHLKTGELLLSLTGNVGRCCTVIGTSYLLNQRVAKLDPVTMSDKGYVQCAFRSPEMRQKLASISNGVAQQNLSPIETAKLPWIVPPSNLRNQFSEVTNGFFELAKILRLKNANLRTTRDLLLPKLISGELDVSHLPEPEAMAA